MPPPFFQRMMAHKFKPLTRKYKSYLPNYLDDWIITMPGEEEGLKLHQQITHKFLNLLQRLSYFLKLSKCEFEKTSIKFLGWLITQEGITIDPSKVAGLLQWPRQLRNIKEVRYTL